MLNEDLSNYVPIPNFEKLYLIDKFGNVWSNHKQRLLNHRLLPIGYHRIALFDKNRMKEYYIHRLVAQIFLPNPNNYPEINHKDGNKGNNCVDNLEWVTHSENHIHSRVILKQLIGEDNGNCKYTKEQIIAIRNDYKNGMNSREIGIKYNISSRYIRQICSGGIWNHIPFEKKKYGSSKYRGVAWDKSNKKWYCSIKFQGKQLYIGRFVSELEAAKAYNKKAIELLGTEVKLNGI